ncbi:histo-blood group ABO system transferase-like [Diceros bicornis minor]|uniref:histo-blood group ABO system transferase-like n=1 Tax=Diceros bicornis minor TaxID=77932 RepID=UPI0026F20179|nr:histo-blood group ABO system transferase-like [Diceros bicornis minor]
MAQLLQRLAGTQRRCSLHRVTFLLLIALALAFFGYCYLKPRSQKLEGTWAGASVAVRERHGLQDVKLSRMVYPQPHVLTLSREDVLLVTPWLAPIIWDKTFNIDILNEQFRLQNATIGLTVFAVEKYIVYLKRFLETAEMHFMVGHKVNYYVFTDRPEHVPLIRLQKGRQIVILKVRSYSHWQDISMHRMEMISSFSEQRFHQEVDYLVCADVDVIFSNHVGVEILSSLFGTLHPGFYGLSRHDFNYEHRPRSQACIPEDEGDFYYIGSLFGGSVAEVYRLAKACHEAMMVDQHNHIEAVWHDESHLNKYLLYHKPSKVLSPEYMWNNQLLPYLDGQHVRRLFNTVTQVRVKVLPKLYQLRY